MWGSKGSGQGQFKYPQNVAVTNQEEVFVADRDNHRIQVFTLQGVFQRMIGSKGNGQGQFSYPCGVAVSNQGLFVTDSGNSRVQVFH